LREDREEETTSLSGTSLGTSHEITAAHNDGDGVLLDGGGDLVVGHLDVAAQVLVQRRSGELVDSLGNILTRGLNGNVVVLLEVDTGVLLGRIIDSTEKLTLDAGVSRTGNVLSVAPLSVARATGSVVAATTARVTVEVAASARVSSAATPTTSAVATAAAGGSIVVVGRDVIAPVGLTSTVVLVSPSTVAESVGTLSRGSTVHRSSLAGSRTRTRSGTRSGTGGRRTARAASHVRRNVGSRLVGTALRSAAVGAQVEGAHVELIGHIEWSWKVGTRVGGQEGNQVVRNRRMRRESVG